MEQSRLISIVVGAGAAWFGLYTEQTRNSEINTISNSMDYYNILGVTPNASDSDIKAAYRKLAMQHHPDRGGDSTQFAKINQAYEVLKDPARRAQYDNPNPKALDQRILQGMGGFEDLFSNLIPIDGIMQNKNVQIAHTIELLDVFRGKSVITKYNHILGRTETLEINILLV